ncbi:MAG: glycine--tRNA ligase [Sporichthyaceae bacterium]
MSPDRVEQIVALGKRRGFGFPSADIYHHGVGADALCSAWDFGPLGVELKENVKRQWWKACVQGRDDVVGLDSAVILPFDVWQTSGGDAAEMLMQCQICRQRTEVVGLEPGAAKFAKQLARIACRHCGTVGSLSAPAPRGSVQAWLDFEDGQRVVHHLRPDPTQGILVNFANVMRSARRRPPFGIGQIGRSFRNETEPGHALFRTHEFEQMGLAWFAAPGTDDEWHRYWIEQRWDWYLDLGLAAGDLRRHTRVADPRRPGSVRTVDIEFRFRFPEAEWGKLEGLANRTDVDLLAHSRRSGVDLSYFDQATDSRWTPYVIAPTAGLSRCVLAFLCAALHEDFAADANGVPQPRSVLRLDPRLAPVKAAILPLSRNSELSPRGVELATALRRHWNVEYDDSGAIGRRYRRQDEIGTPFCVTIDFDTATDRGVTVRERDTMKQERVSLDRLEAFLAERLVGC